MRFLSKQAGTRHIVEPNAPVRAWSIRQTCYAGLVTDHTSSLIGGQPLGLLLRTVEPLLVDRILTTLTAEITTYARLPRELLDGDVRRVVARALQMFVSAMDEDGIPAEADLAELTASAERRAEEGVPMSMVVAAYFRGAAVASQWAMGQATPDELDAVRRTAALLITYLEHVASAVAAGYAEHAETVLAERASARQALTLALLDGDVTASANAAERAGMRLPPAYVAVAIAAGTHPDEDDETLDRSVATRRKLRRIREELQRSLGDAVLWLQSGDGGLALVPVADPPDLRPLRAVVPALERSAGTPLHVALAGAHLADVRSAATQAREVLDVARSCGLPPGAWELADVAVEYQLTRPSPALDLLRARLAVLDRSPELARTLSVYLTGGLRRRQTARELGVHPNTVDNRLKRISALTGLDPTRPDDLPTIRAALAARSAPS